MIIVTGLGVYGIYLLTKNIDTTLAIGVDMFVALGVLVFAYVQIGVNRKLIDLQDYVAISIVPDPNTPLSVRLYNTGKLNIYIHRIEIRDFETDILIGSTDVFKEPRLVPAGTLEQSYYWYPLPKEISEHKKFRLVVLAGDDFNRKWLASHGGEILDKQELRVWSHKTHRKNWKIYKDGEKVPK